MLKSTDIKDQTVNLNNGDKYKACCSGCH